MARVYSHDVPIGRKTCGYILTKYQSDARRAGIFSRRTNRAQDARRGRFDRGARHRGGGQAAVRLRGEGGEHPRDFYVRRPVGPQPVVAGDRMQGVPDHLLHHHTQPPGRGTRLAQPMGRVHAVTGASEAERLNIPEVDREPLPPEEALQLAQQIGK
eukprot:26877-Prorocentrum_minimum.AAC.1